jgi:hypothetical protein
MSLPIEPFSYREAAQEIKNINPRKAPGYDLITGNIRRKLQRKALVLLTTIYNSMLRWTYCPIMWKFAQIIMISKPGKPVNEVKIYRPISLLYFTSTILKNYY